MLEELQSLDVSSKSLRKFGLQVGSIFCCIAVVAGFFKGITTTVMVCGIAGIVLVVCGTVLPKVLRYVYIAWMGIAVVLGWFMSRLILILLFYCVVTPLGLVMRLAGRDLLHIKKTVEKDSCWIEYKEKQQNYEKMY